MRFRFPALTVALLVALATGCDDATTPNVGRSAPSFDIVSDTVTGPILLKYEGPDTGTYVVEGIVNKNGGTIDLGGDHKLIIARGAVDQRTRFVFKAILNKYLIIDLTAYRVSDGVQVSVFASDVTLVVDYTDLKWLGDPQRMSIGYLVDGTAEGRKEKLPSVVDPKTKKVSARLRHFSFYGVLVD